MNQIIEARYPVTFRAYDAQILGEHLHQHNSVVLVGMKRVGISNFLRFFLNHPQVKETYINQGEHCFVLIDLNNLVEKTLYAFWMLTLKRLVDTIEEGHYSDSLKHRSQHLFTESIQLGDFFFTLQTVHKLAKLMVNEGKYLTLFFVRFDRLQEVITPEFFANIQGLKEEVKNLSFVFTSYRSLHEVLPQVFTRADMSVFAHDMYLKPAFEQDTQIILSTFLQRYDVKLPGEFATELLRLSGGHAQYLHLCLIKVKNEGLPASVAELHKMLEQDEQIRFLSEELFASLTPEEQQTLLHAVKKEKNGQSSYLTETGILSGKGKIPEVFSPLFMSYLEEISPSKSAEGEFTKKEFLLFSLLKDNEGELVERDTIIETVWPEEAELGVSDWSIDRLVARVRSKLKSQKSEYKIVTVITRGYKLTRQS